LCLFVAVLAAVCFVAGGAGAFPHSVAGLQRLAACIGPRQHRHSCGRAFVSAVPLASMAGEGADSILCGLDGDPLSHELLLAALEALGGGQGSGITVSVVPGSENKFPTSHSAILSLMSKDSGAPASQLFVKKVSAEAMKHKQWADRRRTLAYSRTEMRFYTEFAPHLVACGVRVPRLAATVDRLGPLLGEDSAVSDPPGDEPPQEVLDALVCGVQSFDLGLQSTVIFYI